MGCSMKRAIFTETVVKGLKNWHKNARRSLSKNRSTSTGQSSNSDITVDFPTDPDTQDKEIVEYEQPPLPSTVIISTGSTTGCPEIVEECQDPYSSIINDQNLDHHATSSITPNASTPEVLKMVEENPKIIAGGTGTYDGEISFGNSWKKLGDSKYHIGEITSIVEEDASDDHILTNFDV